MNRPERRAILCVGAPGTGKTVLLRRITDTMIRQSGYDGIIVLDRTEEWSTELERHAGDLEQQLELLQEDEERVRRAVAVCGQAGVAARWYDGPIVRSAAEYRQVCELLAVEQNVFPPVIPRRTIFRCGRDPSAYGEAIRIAVDQGHCVVVFAEAPDWFTSYERDWVFDAIPGRPDVRLSQLYSQGRAHLPNARGEPCPIHIVCDSQALALVHWKVRQFSNVVLVSQIEGGESYACLKREFGDGTDKHVDAVRALQPRQWLAVRGRMPELAPFRGGGRR
jgi:hypothetical protein